MKFLIALLLASALAVAAQTSRFSSHDLAYNPKVQFEAGKEFVEGDEARKIQEGLALLRKSAGAGNTNAMLLLGRTLKESNPSEAVRWLRQAADKGNSNAAYQTALLLQKTQPTEAVRYLELAAKGGNRSAMINLANRYEMGIGVRIDYNRALALRIQARDWEYAATLAARSNPPDLIKAYMLARVDSQVRGTKSDLWKKLLVQLTPAQIAQGDKAYDAFIRQNFEPDSAALKPARK
jgi:TPR repeat protein